MQRICYAGVLTVALLMIGLRSSSRGILLMDQIGTLPSQVSQLSDLNQVYPNVPNNSRYAADDFTIGVPRLLNWVELHARVTNYANGPVWTQLPTWEVSVWTDSSGAPGTLIYSFLVTASQTTVTQNYSFNINSSVSNALVRIPLGQASLVAGTYWIAATPYEVSTTLRQFTISRSQFGAGFPLNNLYWNLNPGGGSGGNLSNGYDVAYRVDGT
ncbi:MAG: hypothetical protein WAO58_04450 [Fimbriimonadaceae bacterium]